MRFSGEVGCDRLRSMQDAQLSWRSPFESDLELAEAERDDADLFWADLMGLQSAAESLAEEPAVAVPDPLLDRCRATIEQLVVASPLGRFKWPPNRGRAPIGYLKGMAIVYARVYCKWKANDPFVLEMAKKAGTSNSDALKWYAARFQAAGLDNSTDGVDTLRHVFVFLVGLGMIESAGRFDEGRDLSADNTAATTAEAGLFQVSHSVGVGSDRIADGWLKRHYQLLRRRYYSGLMDVFREGVNVRQNRLRGFGDTEGGLFREFCVLEPALVAELVALGIRKRRAHWGPITNRHVTINTDCDQLLRDVQNAVDRENCCVSAT